MNPNQSEIDLSQPVDSIYFLLFFLREIDFLENRKRDNILPLQFSHMPHLGHCTFITVCP